MYMSNINNIHKDIENYILKFMEYLFTISLIGVKKSKYPDSRFLLFYPNGDIKAMYVGFDTIKWEHSIDLIEWNNIIDINYMDIDYRRELKFEWILLYMKAVGEDNWHYDYTWVTKLTYNNRYINLWKFDLSDEEYIYKSIHIDNFDIKLLQPISEDDFLPDNLDPIKYEIQYNIQNLYNQLLELEKSNNVIINPYSIYDVDITMFIYNNIIYIDNQHYQFNSVDDINTFIDSLLIYSLNPNINEQLKVNIYV